MPHDTSIAKDVSIWIQVPSPDGTASSSRMAQGPFVESAAGSAPAKQALAGTERVLDALHQAVRECQLTDAGLEALDTFQHFFRALKTPVEGCKE
jgi:hypothetical protein